MFLLWFRGLGKLGAPERGLGGRLDLVESTCAPWCLAEWGWCVMVWGMGVLLTPGCHCALCSLHVPSVW